MENVLPSKEGTPSNIKFCKTDSSDEATNIIIKTYSFSGMKLLETPSHSRTTSPEVKGWLRSIGWEGGFEFARNGWMGVLVTSLNRVMFCPPHPRLKKLPITGGVILS